MRKLQNILLVEWFINTQIKNKPSFKRIRWVEVSWDMDVVIARRVKCRIECSIQYIFTEIFPNFDVAPLGATVYIGDAGVNDYSSGMETHIKSEE